MLEINPNYIQSNKNILGTSLIVVDNFLLNPNKLVEYLYKNQPANLWKHNEKPSNNGNYFIDKRHVIQGEKVTAYNKHIKKLLNKSNQILAFPDSVYSNFTRFTSRKFNDYYNNYWYPHVDDGYNAILYLNTNGCSGTNIYSYLHNDQYNQPEHYQPWRRKSNYVLEFNIESAYNRLVLFDGQLVHGMAINNDNFFSTERINLVTFFIDINKYV